MVLFKYTGGGQIEAPSIHASDLTVENQPETGEHEEYVCSADMASVIAKCVPSYVTSVLYQISFKQKCAQYQDDRQPCAFLASLMFTNASFYC